MLNKDKQILTGKGIFTTVGFLYWNMKFIATHKMLMRAIPPHTLFRSSINFSKSSFSFCEFFSKGNRYLKNRKWPKIYRSGMMVGVSTPLNYKLNCIQCLISKLCSFLLQTSSFSYYHDYHCNYVHVLRKILICTFRQILSKSRLLPGSFATVRLLWTFPFLPKQGLWGHSSFSLYFWLWYHGHYSNFPVPFPTQ